jgi:tRNA(Ile)-lysidine synthase
VARATVAGFAAEVARLAGPGAAPIALAVSGGPDSLALLWLAATAFSSGERRVAVLSVDHGLRAEAGADCALVAELCRDLGLLHATLTLAMAPGGDVQARARAARYAAMAGWCLDRDIGLLLTAHHADDQAETLLMRSARGSGLAGLAGIRARTDLHGVAVLRPLLGWRRRALADIVDRAGWTAAVDPSNSDPRHDRARVRALLARAPELKPERLAQTAAHLADAEAALCWAADRAFATRSQATGAGLLLDPEALPPEIRRRLLLLGLAQLGATAEGPTLARLMARLGAGGGGTVGPLRVTCRPDGCWLLQPAPPRKRP